MKKTLRILLVVVIVAVLLAGGAALVKKKQMALSKAPRYGLKPLPVHVAKGIAEDLRIKRNYLAVVEPIQASNISARVTAKILKVLCDEGDRVKSGQALVVLDKREVRKNISGAGSQIAQAETDLLANEATVKSLKDSLSYWRREAGRDKALADKGDIAGSQAEATAEKVNEYIGRLRSAEQKSRGLRHMIQSLRDKKAELETRKSYYTIRSPYDGLIRQRQVDPGDMATPGKTLVVVENRSQVRLKFDIPQQDLPDVKEGLEVLFTSQGTGRKATLSHTYPSLNIARMLRAEVYLSGEKAEGLSIGQYIPVSVVVRKIKGVTLLPRSCLIEGPGQEDYVFVVQDDRLVARPVKVIGTSADNIAVDGIMPDEQVVTNTFLGWARLSAENRVEVQP